MLLYGCAPAHCGPGVSDSGNTDGLQDAVLIGLATSSLQSSPEFKDLHSGDEHASKGILQSFGSLAINHGGRYCTTNGAPHGDDTKESERECSLGAEWYIATPDIDRHG